LQEIIHPSQLPKFLGGQLATPLDELLSLPRVENHDDLEEKLKALPEDWDGFWGLPSATPVEAPAACKRAGAAGSAEVSPLVSNVDVGKRPVTNEHEARVEVSAV